MLLARGIDPQGGHQTVLADMEAIDQQRDQIEIRQRPRPPFLELGGRLDDEASADRALARAAARHRVADRLQTSRILPG